MSLLQLPDQHGRSAAGESRLWLLAMVLSLVALLAAVAFVGLATRMPHGAPNGPGSAAGTNGRLVDAASYPAPAFALRDQNGALVTAPALRGHVTLLGFLDPICTSICPLLGRQLAMVQASVPSAQRPDVVMVSVAPHRTSAQATAFAHKAGLAAGWRFLLGPAAGLAPTWKAFRVTVIPSTGDVEHDGAVVVLDRAGQVRDEFYAPFPSALLTAEVKALAGP